MEELLRKSLHQPEEIVAVQEKDVKDLLATGMYFEIEKNFTPSENVHRKEDVFFSNKLTEKEIKNKIEKYNVPINYNISNDNKKDILVQLKKLGYNVR